MIILVRVLVVVASQSSSTLLLVFFKNSGGTGIGCLFLIPKVWVHPSTINSLSQRISGLGRLRKRAAAVGAHNDLSLRNENGVGLQLLLQLLRSPSLGTRLVVSAQRRTRIALSSGKLSATAIQHDDDADDELVVGILMLLLLLKRIVGSILWRWCVQ